MKDYMNRNERNDLMFLFGFVASCDVIDKGLKSVLTDEEKTRMHEAEGIMRAALESVIQRIGSTKTAIGRQLLRESESVKMDMYLKGETLVRMGEGCVTMRSEMVRQLTEWAAGQCIGCDGIEDCPLLQVRDMLDEPPVNPGSAICQYRIDAEELTLDEEVALDGI